MKETARTVAGRLAIRALPRHAGPAAGRVLSPAAVRSGTASQS